MNSRKLFRIFGFATSVLILSTQFFATEALAAVASPLPIKLENGGFEDNPKKSITDLKWYNINQSNFPYWNTTSTDDFIEIWRSGFQPKTGSAVKSNSGNWHAEINATQSAQLYQDIATLKGSLYKWSGYHRGRNGVDTARLLLGGKVASDINGLGIISDGTSWGYHEGYYTATATITRFGLEDLTTSDGAIAQGNFIDDLAFYRVADPTEQTIWVNDPKPSDKSLLTPLISGLTASYASASEYSASDLDDKGMPILPPDLSKTGKHLVKVKITDSKNKVAGYVYSIINVKSKLTVKYVDESGTPLKTDSITVYTDPDAYNVTVPAVGDPLNVSGVSYQFKQIGTTSDSASGNMTTDKTVILVYTLPAPPVGTNRLTINYVDSSGAAIKSPSISSYNSGDPYTTMTPTVGSTIIINGDTYEFVQVKSGSDPSSGTMNADKSITYVYNLVPPAPTQYTVTTKFVDEGGTPILPKVVDTYNDGDPYAISPMPPAPGTRITVSGNTYEFVQLASGSDSPSGTVDGNKEVVLEYRLVPNTTRVLTINYEDDNGTTIIPVTAINKNDGDSYSVTPPTVGDIIVVGTKSYKFVQVESSSDPLSGNMDSDKEITYKYTLVTTPATQTREIVINYVDKNGVPIQLPTSTTKVDGSIYTVSPPQVGDTIVIGPNTYKFVAVDSSSDSLTGTMNGDKNITYKFEYVQVPAVPGKNNIIVSYLDESGLPIQPQNVTQKNAGDTYTVNPPSPGDIVTINGKTYRFESVDPTSDSLTGTVNVDKNIIYHFVEVKNQPTPTPYRPSPTTTPTPTQGSFYTEQDTNSGYIIPGAGFVMTAVKVNEGTIDQDITSIGMPSSINNKLNLSYGITAFISLSVAVIANRLRKNLFKK